MKDLLHDPAAAWILLGTLVSFGLSRTRFATCTLLAAILVLLASVEVACFDGKRHLTPKLDATFFAWGRAVELRAVAGVTFVLLGALVGTLVGRLTGRRRGALFGAIALGPFGVGLLGSSVALQASMRTILAEGSSAEARLGQLRAAISQSTWLVGGGTVVSVLACIAIAGATMRVSLREAGNGPE